MASPEENILQQADQLAAQRDPGFATENLPSPKGFTPPNIAPIPIPGTGMTEGGTKNDGQGAYLNKFKSDILSTSDSPITPGNLPNFTAADVYNPRYNSILPGEDSEEAFALGQPWYKKWGNSVAKMGITAGGTFLNGMMSIPDTIANIGKSSPYDSSTGNAVDSFMKNSEDWFPNYYTKWETEHPFMSALPFSGGFSNFWGDKVLKNMGFTIGAIGAAAVQDAVLTAAGGALGAVAGVSNNIGRASLWLNKIFTGADKVADLQRIGSAAGRTGQQLLDLERLAATAQTVKLANGTKYALNMYAAAASEAGFEAREGYNSVKQDLLEAYQRENGYSATGQELADIERHAEAAGNVRFGVNMAILSASNAIQFDAFIKPYRAAKAGRMNQIRKDLANGSEIVQEPGIAGAFKLAPSPTTMSGKVWGKVKPTTKAILSEGVFEEGGQFATQIGTQNYYERKYLFDKGLERSNYSQDETPFDSRDQMGNIVHSMVSGLAAQFTTDEGLENMLLGSLTGGIFGAVTGRMSRGETARMNASTLNLLNSKGITGFMQDNYNTATKALRIAEDMKEAVAQNNIFKYKNFQHEQFVEFINSGIKAGRFDVRMEQLEMLRDLSDKEFKTAFGLDQTVESTATARKYVDALQTKAKEIKKTYDLIDKNFTNPFTHNAKAKTDSELLENEKFMQFENWKSDLTYLGSIALDVDTRKAELHGQIASVAPMTNLDTAQNLTNKKYLKDTLKRLNEEAKALTDAIDQKLSPNAAIDRTRATMLTNKAKVISDLLGTPTPTRKDIETAFTELANFQLNGETGARTLTIPPAAITELVDLGMDANKLDELKAQAYTAFDRLSTEEGFDKYFQDVERGKAKQQEAYNTRATPPGQPVPPVVTPKATTTATTTPAKPVPVTVQVKNEAGETKTFEKDKPAFVNVGEDNPVEGVVVGQTKDGITVEKTDGTQVVVPTETFFAKDPLDEQLNSPENSSVENIPPPPEQTGTPETKVGESKKDLSFFPNTTTDPTYKTPAPYDDFHKRHQRFLYNLGKKGGSFNQKDKGKLRIIPVTANTVTLLGLPENLIGQGTSVATDNAVIRAVYVIQDGDRFFFIDENGNRVSEVGPVTGKITNPADIIFSTFTSTELTFGADGEQRYTNKTNVDPQKVQSWWRSERARMLNIKFLNDIPVFQFAVSRGFPNSFTTGTRNSVVSVGLVTNEDLNQPVITVATAGNVSILGAYNEDGQGVDAFSQNVNMPLGTPLLNFGGNMIFLNNRKFTPAEAKNVVDLLAILADRKTSENKSAIFKFLNKVVHIANIDKKILPGANSITISGNSLYLGTDKKPILMTPESVEANREMISTFLQNTFQNTNVTELNRIKNNPKATDLNFSELAVKDGKVVVANNWSTYNHYLLSNVNPDGKNRGVAPLTTDIAIPQPGEVPIIGKYAVLKGTDFDASMYKLPDVKPAPVAPKTPVPTPTSTPADGSFKLPEDQYEYLEFNGMKLAFQPTAKDADGKITDIKPLGKIQDDGSILPYKDPAKVKVIIMDQLNPKTEERALPFDNTPSEKKKRIKEEFDKDFGEKTGLVGSVLKNEAKEDSDIDIVIRSVPNKPNSDKKISPAQARENSAFILEKLKPLQDKGLISGLQLKAEGNLGVTFNYKGQEFQVSPNINENFDSIPAKVEQAQKEQGISVAKDVEFVELTFGQTVVRAGFKVVSRDANGNVTDIEPVGSIQPDGSTKPFNKPDVIKSIILDSLGKSTVPAEVVTPAVTPTKASTTEEDDDEGLGNPNLTKGPDTQYRVFTQGNGDYKRGNLAEEFAEFQRILPDSITIRKVDQMLRTTSGGLAWGALQGSMVYIYENAEVGTTYHEAFEAVWGHFLTPTEQRELYNEFVRRDGKFMTYNGKTKSFSEASFKEAKEQMAEEFRDYKLNGSLPKAPKQRNFFKQLLDFIKRLILGDSSDLNLLFKRMNKGYYRNFPSPLRSMTEPQYREMGLDTFSETVIQDTIQGMTAEMFADIFKDSSDILAQFEESNDLAARTIYERLKQKLKFFFEDKAAPSGTLTAEFGVKYQSLTADDDKAAMRSQVKAIRSLWTKIEGNWDEFVKEHKKHLKVFNVEFIVDDDGEISFRDEDTGDDNKSQTEYDRDIFTINAKENASAKVKLLMATLADSEWVRQATTLSIGAARNNEIAIKRSNSQLALPKLAPYAKIFNYILHNTTNINGMYNIWGKLKSLVASETRKNIDANTQRLINRLDFDKGFEGKTKEQAKLLLSLENTLSKQKPSFFRQFVDFQKNTFFVRANTNSKTDQYKKKWIADIKGSKAVKAANNKFIFDPKVLDVKDNIEFLNTIGINITREEYNKLKGKPLTDFNEATNVIRRVIQEAAQKKTAIPVVSSKQLDFDSRLQSLAEVYAIHITGDDTQSQHSNLDSEQTSNFVLNNFVSTVLNDANASPTRGEFVNIPGNGYMKDIFHADSILLNEILFSDSGDRNRMVELGVAEGRESWDKQNKGASKLTEAERQVYEINNNLNGVFYTLLPADAKTEWSIKTGTYLSAANFFGDDAARGNETTKFANQMYKWLQTEINLAKDYDNRKDISALNRKLGNRTVGNSLRFFFDILPAEIVDRIHKEVIDGTKPLSEVVSASDMRALVRQYAMDKAQRTLDNLVSWKVVGMNGKDDKIQYRLNGFDKLFLDTHIGKKQYFTQQETQRLLAFREMNYVMNQIELHKFFFGDPAQYKDELKRIKSFLSGRESMHVDTVETSEGFNQWANENLNTVNGVALKMSDPGYHQFKNHANTFTVLDVDFQSRSLDGLKEALGDSAQPYEGGVEADAQAWVSATAYREMMYKSGGRFTAAQENQFQFELAWERNDKFKQGTYTYSSKELQAADNAILAIGEDTDVAFPILKFMHSGIQDVNNQAVMSLDKASWAPLFYRWYKGRAMEGLYDEMQRRGTDYVRMESAHKVGIQKSSLTRLYNEKGNINLEGISQLKDETIPYKQFGVQVEQAKKDKGQTEGSQARKIVVGDLNSNGVPIDYLSEFDTEDDAYVAWNNLSAVEKLNSSVIHQKIQRHDRALSNLTNKRVDIALDKLGVTFDADGTVRYADKTKVSAFILDELERRELPRNIGEGLEINPTTGDFMQPLEANAQYAKIRSILYSMLEKTVMRPKVNGGQKTMLAVTGMETGSRIVAKEVNGKPVYTSNELRFYSNDGGKTQACEVMLPYWFGKRLMESGSKRTKGEVIDYLKNDPEGQKLLRGIGFRIPTQGLNSIDIFVVKDFLPEQMGDVIVLPSEITVKAGSDFDIDKLNTYLYNFYVDNETGLPKLIEYKGSESATIEYINDILEKTISAGQRNALAREIDENTPEYNAYAVDLITDEFLGDKKARIIDRIYSQALENEYFDSMEELIALPENFRRLVIPNDASELKGYRTKLLGLKGTQGSNLGVYGRLLDSVYMMQERQAYMSSKQVVGTSAVSQTAHALSQNMPGGVVVQEVSIVPRFPHNTIGGRPTLSGMYITGTDSLISNVNSQTTDGGVDVAKDKFLAEMGINQDTLGTFLTLVRMGAKPWWAITFLNQPAIQEFLKLKAIGTSVSQINPSVQRKGDKLIVRQVGVKFGKFDAKMSKPKMYTITKMEEMIKADKLSAADKLLQMQMLDDYLKYVNLGWDVFHFYQGYNWDTARLNDPNSIRLKKLKLNKAKTLSISSAQTILDNTFIGDMAKGSLTLDESLRALINVQSGAAGIILNQIAEDLFKQRGLSEEDRRKILMDAELAMLDYSIHVNGQIKGTPIGAFIQPVLLSQRSVARYVDALKKLQDKRIANNPFIQNLLVTLDTRQGYPSTVTMIERDFETYTSNVWTDAFREMKDDATVVSIDNNPANDRSVSQIYNNLVIASVLQSGTKRKGNSFTHLIPNETYSQFVTDSLRNMNLNGFYENDVLYRTGWQNDLLVPRAELEFADDDLANPDIPGAYPILRDAQFMEILKDITGKESPSNLLTPLAWKFANKRFLKIVSAIRDPNTRQIVSEHVALYKRIDVSLDGQSVPLKSGKDRVYFKQVNAWGSSEVAEFYNGTNPSILPDNLKIDEIADEDVIIALYRRGRKNFNMDEEALSAIITNFEEQESNKETNEDRIDSPSVEDTIPDEFNGTQTSEESDDPLFQVDPFTAFKDKLIRKDC